MFGKDSFFMKFHAAVLLLCGFFLFVGEESGAEGNFSALDVGAYVSNLTTRVHTSVTHQSKVSQITGFLRFRQGISLSQYFLFEPSLSTVVPWFSGSDGNAKTFTFHLGLNLKYGLFRFVHLRAGPGIQSDWIVSSGQAVTLNNGTSTSTFFMPGGIQTIFLATVHGGLEISLSRRVSLSVDTIIQSIANPSRRRVQASLGLGILL